MNSPFRIKKSAILSPVASPTLTLQGEMAYDSAADVIKVRNSASTDSLAQIAAAQVLTNKTMDGGDNTFSNIDYASLVLSNSIVNADIAAAAAIDFSKLAALTAGNILVGNGSNVATSVAMSGEATISNAGAVTLSNAAVIGKVLTGYVAGAGVVAATDTILQAIQKLAGSNTGTNTGDVSLTAVGAVPNANGASLSGQALTLQPADATNPGLMTAGPQNLGGLKLFNDGLAVLGPMLMYQEDNNTATGTAATIGETNNPVVVLQDSGLLSVTGIQNASGDAKFIVLTNSVGSSITVLNNAGTLSERILTGTGGDLTLAANASIILYYNGADAKWYVVGGSGGGSSGAISLTAGENLVLGDAVYVSIGAGDGGRTAGRAYKLDATNDNRMEFIGIVQSAASVGNPVTIQQAGQLTGLSGLSTGEPVYASVTVPGGNQSSAPVASGQWIIQLGIAVNATTMSINSAGSAVAVKISSNGIGPYLSTSSKTANYTATANDDVLLCDASSASFTITLPAASSLPGKTYHVKKTDSSVNTITLDGNASETIDGLLTQVIATQYQTISIVNNGSNWSII